MDAGEPGRRRPDGRGGRASGWPAGRRARVPARRLSADAGAGGDARRDPATAPARRSTRVVLLEVPEEVLVRRALRAGARDDDQRRGGARAPAGLPREDRAAGRATTGSAGLLREVDGDRPMDEVTASDPATRCEAGVMMVLKTPGELELMDEANRIVHRVLDGLAERIAPGSDHRRARPLRGGARSASAAGCPAFLDYQGYPATLCTSVNDVIVHGIPATTVLREGDILGSTAEWSTRATTATPRSTFAGRRRSAPRRGGCSTVTRRGLDLAVEQVRPGRRLSDIGHAVQSHVEAQGFSVVREFVGHGIGTLAARGSAGAELRRAGAGPEAAAGAGPGDRADGQRRRRRA